MPFGAEAHGHGVRFRLYAPGAARVEVGLGDADSARWLPLARTDEGWHALDTDAARAGTRYRYRVDGGQVVPDPAARYNPGDVHGDSEVCDPAGFDWTDDDWRGRPWHEAALYELHVGTFSPEGTFAGVEARLDHLADLGVTAIELMPVADFPGHRGWGYDGVLPFAPDASYGSPEALKSLVAAAHARGLMVLLDVVYNHLGPEGNYLPRLVPWFFTDRHRTPWGEAIDFDGPHSRPVRDFFIHNALYWLEEFNVDGLRLDAVHAIADDSRPDILAELAAAVREGPGRARERHLVLENDRNDAQRLVRDAARRPLQYTAQWNDDFHHVLHHLVTGERDGYYADYADHPVERLGRCLAQGFAFQGEASPFRNGAARGTPSASLPPEAFVNFLQNHDQVGNRAFGERIGALAEPAALKTALAVLLLAPSPPLLFMGEEFGADTPFLYFCDFEPELGEAVRRGRREEFAGFAAHGAAGLPDPCDPATRIRSLLDWTRVAEPPHAAWLAHCRALLACRTAKVVPMVPHLVPGRARWQCPRPRVLEVRWQSDDGRALVLQASFGAHQADATFVPPAHAQRLWSSHEQAGWSADWWIEPEA
jgi:malto-oligosyltrehalose trehalohydrolase